MAKQFKSDVVSTVEPTGTTSLQGNEVINTRTAELPGAKMEPIPNYRGLPTFLPVQNNLEIAEQFLKVNHLRMAQMEIFKKWMKRNREFQLIATTYDILFPLGLNYNVVEELVNMLVDSGEILLQTHNMSGVTLKWTEVENASVPEVPSKVSIESMQAVSSRQ